MKFGYTIVYVSSVTNTLQFYKKAFGFETRFLHESEQYGELNTGETVLAFASHTMGEMNFVNGYQKTDSSASPLGIELAFVTEEVFEAYSKAISLGATSISEPIIKPWGQTVAYVRDADGVIVELCSPM
ncbi:VOC family protein [Colwellia sp. MSW7]|uniref:VOC family protein n=1 Tax=Colwellia maritima TaxID=2912588 RepID=A0ABS9X4C8_9GAMM|nr:VOC family protein [Colwellia maritima]MCI2285094.1 VOC family protein [Colwellia maritima]